MPIFYSWGRRRSPALRQSLARVAPQSTVIIVSWIFMASMAQAWPPTYSGEIEVSNPHLRAGDYGEAWDWAIDRKDGRNQAAQEQYRKLMVERCASVQCSVEVRANSIGLDEVRIKYPKGFYFDVTLDPGILEAKVKPSTLDELTAVAPLLQRDLFDAMGEIGLRGSKILSAGHIHVGLFSAFGDDPLLLRNVMVDYGNHPELAAGGMMKFDRYNAIPLASHAQVVRDRIRSAVNLFDSGKIDIRELLGKWNWALEFAPKPYTEGTYNAKYNALNIYRAVDPAIPDAQRTIEFRAIGGYESAEQYVRIVQLLDSRIRYLKTVRHPIAFIDQPVPRSNTERALRTRDYLLQTGLEPEKYEFMVPAAWLKDFRSAPVTGCLTLEQAYRSR